ncbi:MAG: hypothetical protein WC869_11655, partial [Phycisphaerae bacterium]
IFGSTAADRYLVALVTARDNANDYTVTSATIGGVAATINADAGAVVGSGTAVVLSALVASGSSGDVVVNWSEEIRDDQLCTLLRVTGITSNTAYDSAVDSSTATVDSISASLDVEAGGLVVAVMTSNNSSRTVSWSLANEVVEQADTGAVRVHSAAYEVPGSASTPLAVTATLDGNSNMRAIAAASFSPVTSVAYTLDCAAGSFALTGQDVGLTTQFKIDASQGSYTLTGIDVDLKQGYGLIAEAGSFVLTGNDVAFAAALTMAAGTGAYALTGNDAGLSAGYQIAADVGSFTLTGIDVAFMAALSLAADVGSFTLTGQDVDLTLAMTLNAETGVFILTGQDVTLSFSGWATVPGVGDWTTQAETATWVAQGNSGSWTTRSGTATWTIQTDSDGWVVQ